MSVVLYLSEGVSLYLDTSMGHAGCIIRNISLKIHSLFCAKIGQGKVTFIQYEKVTCSDKNCTHDFVLTTSTVAGPFARNRKVSFPVPIFPDFALPAPPLGPMLPV